MKYSTKKPSDKVWEDWTELCNSIKTGTIDGEVWEDDNSIEDEAWEDEDWVEDDDNEDGFFITQPIPVNIQQIVGIRDHWEQWHNQQLLIINQRVMRTPM